MKLSRLLEIHHDNQTNLGLPKNLGDDFLIQHNDLYCRIREKASRLGFKYTDQMDTKYLALPLSQLETILKTKSIPYVDNVSVLMDVEKQRPNVTTWDDVTDNLKKNHVFHESCHAIARTISQSIFKEELTSESQILRLLIEESFSNTCELLGIIDAEDSVHRIFYELNSYVFMYEDRTQLKRLVNTIGYCASVRLLIVSYLFSNFLHDKISESDFVSVLKLLNLQHHPAVTQKVFRSVCKIAFELNPRFRWVTTTFYLRLHGMKIAPAELNKIGFMALVIKDPRFLSFIDKLSQFEMWT